jgi:Tfp pilus assembly protein PilN
MGSGPRGRDPTMVITGFNLATSNYRRTKRTLLVLGVASAVLFLVLAVQLVVWFAQHRENRAVKARLATMAAELGRHQSQAKTVQTKLPAEAIKQYEAKVAAYNQILEASAFSWIGLLVELERSVPPGVTIASIQPDLVSGKVGLNGEAASFDDLTKLLRGLEQRTVFKDVFLLRQAIHKGPRVGSNAVDFSVSLIYQGRPQ